MEVVSPFGTCLRDKPPSSLVFAMGKRIGGQQGLPFRCPRQRTWRSISTVPGSAVLAGRLEGVAPSENVTVRILPGAADIPAFDQAILGEIQPISQGDALLNRDQSEYEIGGIEPGTYTVLATCWQANSHGSMIGEARFATALIEIAEGETRTLDFDLR